MESIVIAFALGVLLVSLVSSLAAVAGEHAERDRRIRVAVLRSRGATCSR